MPFEHSIFVIGQFWAGSQLKILCYIMLHMSEKKWKIFVRFLSCNIVTVFTCECCLSFNLYCYKKPALELHSWAAPSVEAHHSVNGPNTGRNSGGRQIKKVISAVCITEIGPPKSLTHTGREISIQGEGALPLLQLSIGFKISGFGKHSLYFLPFQQLSLKLIDSCTSGSTPSPCIDISLHTGIEQKPFGWQVEESNYFRVRQLLG